MRNYFLFLAIQPLFCTLAFASASNASCKVIGNKVVSVYEGTDANDNGIIIGMVGSFDTDPQTWNSTTLSQGIGTQNTDPFLFANVNGDVAVFWTSIDATVDPPLFSFCASLLPVGQNTWSTSNISGMLQSDYEDIFVSIDEAGNIFAVWTYFDPNSNAAQVACNFATMSSLTWDGPFVFPTFTSRKKR